MESKMITPNLKKPRLFYLDFVRAFALIMVLLCHFNVPLVPTPPRTANVISTTMGGIYIGAFGVGLFFIISGAALMYVYQDE